MLIRKNKNSLFLNSKLVFKVTEKPSDSDAEILSEVGRTAIENAKKNDDPERKKAIESGRKRANLPKIPDKIKGLNVKTKPVKKGDSVEQDFQFGDLRIPGKIVMPSNPEKDKKTTILFNYVDDPAKFDHGKFMKELKDSKMDLGNTMIVTIKTPEGKTRVGKEQVDTMAALVGDIEKFQKDLGKNPAYQDFKDMNLTRAENILHIASKGEAPKVKKLLKIYKEKTAETDYRAARIGEEVDITVQGLQARLKSIEEEEKKAEEEKEEEGKQDDTNPTVGGGGGIGGGGGMSGGGGGMGAGVVESGGTDMGSDSGIATGSEITEVGETTSTGVEVTPAEGVHNLLVAGDSLLNHSGKLLKAGDKISLEAQKGGTSTVQTAKKLEQMDTEGKLENFRGEKMVINSGVNDIANYCRLYVEAGAKDSIEEYKQKSFDKIIKSYERIWQTAQKYNISVYQNTLVPFRNTSWEWLNTEKLNPPRKDIADANEEIRKRINDELISRTGKPNGPYKIIPLHKTVSEGGLADDNDSSIIHKEYAQGDNLHLKGDGIKRMAEIMQGVLGEPLKEKPTTKVSEYKEAEPGSGVDNIVLLGDSNMVPMADRIKANQKEKFAKNGRPLSVMLEYMRSNKKKFQRLNTSLSPTTIITNGGGNDLAAGRTADQIFGYIPEQSEKLGYMQEMAKIAKEIGAKLVFCALPPFGGTTNRYLGGENFTAKNAEREEINKRLRMLANRPEYKDVVSIIPLDKPEPVGLADPTDPTKLADTYRKGNDGLHLNLQSYPKVAAIIQSHIGTPVQGIETTSENRLAQRQTGDEYIKSLSPQERKKFDEWISNKNSELWAKGGKPGDKHEVKYNGKTFTIKLAIHNYQARSQKSGTFQASELVQVA